MARRYARPLTTPAAARAVRDYTRPFVSLLTDFGVRDPSAAICRAIVLGIAPDALVVDVSHEVAKYEIRDGALLLWCAIPYLPVGAHVGVVDPGVGTERLPIAVETIRGDVLIGPDNGLLIPAAERVGGIASVHLLENPEYRLPIVSASFHGRDIFAPAAAHVALGVPIHALGRPLDPGRLATVGWPRPEVRDGELRTEAIYVDTFGNVKLAGDPHDLLDAIGEPEFGTPVEIGLGAGPRRRTLPARWVETFGRVGPGELLVYEDSYGRLCLAENHGSAASRLKMRTGTAVSISRA